MKLKSCIKINLTRFYMKPFFFRAVKSCFHRIQTQNLANVEELKHVALCSPKAIWVKHRARSKSS